MKLKARVNINIDEQGFVYIENKSDKNVLLKGNAPTITIPPGHCYMIDRDYLLNFDEITN